jgi:hypothetical protein
MQRFNAPLAPEDRKVARRINRIVLIAYSSMALLLAADVAARVIPKDPAVARAPVETTTKTAVIGGNF